MFAKKNAVFNYISTGYINFLEFLSCTECTSIYSDTWCLAPERAARCTCCGQVVLLLLLFWVSWLAPDWEIALLAKCPIERGKIIRHVDQLDRRSLVHAVNKAAPLRRLIGLMAMLANAWAYMRILSTSFANGWMVFRHYGGFDG
jgi:hypothetical protein